MSFYTTVRNWQSKVHAVAVSKGWWVNVDVRSADVIAARLALVHSEVSEALEDLRKRGPVECLKRYYGENGKPEGLDIELADAVIRVMDISAALDIDLEAAMREKHEYNKTRSTRHGGKAL